MDRMVERANKCYRWHNMVARTSVRGERRGCEKLWGCKNQLVAAKLEKNKNGGEKGGKEMARPYTKTGAGHEDRTPRCDRSGQIWKMIARERRDTSGRVER
jgi:hypothetical protein